MTELAAAAMSYAALGWPVFPLAPRGKEPVTSRGFLQATDDANQVEWYWEKTPEANIGLRTGVAFDALDIDGPEGMESLNGIAPGYKHQGPVSATGRGYHLLFAATGKPNFANPVSNGGPHAGIDYRGKGGYIVAAPSIHPLGHRYQWVRPPNLALPEAPAWLMDLFPKPLERLSPVNAVAGALGSLDLVTELTRIGCVLRPYGGNKLKGCCPFHPDRDPSFIVYLDTQSFFCFSCRAWGDALNVRRWEESGSLH